MASTVNVRKVVQHFGGPTVLHGRLKREGHTLALKTVNMWITRNSIPGKWQTVLNQMAYEDNKPLNWTRFMDDAEQEMPDFLE